MKNISRHIGVTPQVNEGKMSGTVKAKRLPIEK